MDAIEAGHAFINLHYPDSLAAIVAGSAIRGEATPTSDLDIVVITERDNAPYRESLRAFGWPIESFVHTTDSLRHYFTLDIERGRPSLVMMCHEGAILQDRDGRALRIKEEARTILENGPEPLSDEQLASQRYAVTDLLDDFLG